MSLEPLPASVKELSVLKDDLKYCATTVALWKKAEVKFFEQTNAFYASQGKLD